MSITPEQLAELEKKLSSVQNPTYSVAELCSFDELVNQLMPSLIAAARDLDEIKSGRCAKWTIEVEQDRDQWKERAEKAESSIQDLVKAKGRYNTQLAYEKLALSSSAPPGCDFPDPPIDGAPTA